MSTRWHLWAMAITALAAVAAFVILSAPPAAATNDPDPGGGTVTGDWTVTDGRFYSSVTIVIESGNLTVSPGGSLTLDSVVLRFNGAVDGDYSLEVQQGGALYILDMSNVSSSQPGFHYRFVVSGSMVINASAVTEVWGDDQSWAGGIQIYNDSVSITNSSILNGRTGGISIFNCSPEIYNCDIAGSGQDGGSETYAYGVYGFGTRSNITYNRIYENSYIELIFSTYTLTKNPTTSTVLWNGNYYSGSASLYYRYEYYYYNNRSDIFGCGVRLDGGSSPYLAYNTISRNGWGFVGGNFPQVKIDEGSKHELRKTVYVYCGNRLLGTGIYATNCTVEMVGNAMDQNGFNPGSLNSYSTQYPTFYSKLGGTAVTMVDCTGNITGNTLTNSVILINNTRSSPNIDGNILTTAFLRYTFSGIENAYGILNTVSKPYIANNTITLTVEDWMTTAGTLELLPLKAMVGIDNQASPGISMVSNKIVTETKGTNIVAGISVNCSFLSTDMWLYNNTFEHRTSGSGTSPSIPDYFAIIRFTYLSTGLMENNKMNLMAGGTSTGASRTVAGLLVAFDSNVTLRACNITNTDRGVVIAYSAEATFEGCRVLIATGPGTAFVVGPGCSAQIVRTVISSAGTATGISATGGTVTVLGSSMHNPKEVVMDAGAVVELLNTTHEKESYFALDNESRLNVSWPVLMQVNWQNGKPAVGASLSLLSVDSEEVYRGVAGIDGYTGPAQWIKEYSILRGTLSAYTPHHAYASLGRAASLAIYRIGGPENLSIMLVDSLPPLLSFITPGQASLINSSTFNISGSVSDPESGVLGLSVEVKLDALDWATVPLNGTAWSIERQLEDGYHQCLVRATDTLGNSITSMLAFTVDTSPPSLWLTSPRDGLVTNQRTLAVNGEVGVDATLTVNGKLVQPEERRFSVPISLDEGSNNITVYVVDAAGNSVTLRMLVTLDTLPPLPEVTSPLPGSYTNQSGIVVTGTIEPGSTVRVNGQPTEVAGTVFQTVVSLSEGQNPLTVTASDPAGNTQTIDLVVFLDTVPPDLVLDSPLDGSWTNNPSLLVSGTTENNSTVTVNGGVTGVSNGFFSSQVLLSEGKNTITVDSRGRAGNHRYVEATIYLDTVPPQLVVESPVQGQASRSSAFTVRGFVDTGAAVTINGRPASLTDFSFSVEVVFSSEGPHNITIEAQDQAGNSATVARTVIVDTVPPALTLSSPSDGSSTGRRLVEVRGITEPFSTVTVNGETVFVTGQGGNFSVTVPLEPGKNLMIVRSTDPAGNTASAVRTVKLASAGEGGGGLTSQVAGSLVELGIAIFLASALVAAVLSLRKPKRPAAAPEEEGEEEAEGENAEDEEDQDEEKAQAESKSEPEKSKEDAAGKENGAVGRAAGPMAKKATGGKGEPVKKGGGKHD